MSELSQEQVSILLVDDQPEGLLALTTTLDPLRQRLVTARSGSEALRLILRDEFALILMDVVMPEMDGFETAQLIRQRDRSKHTPIIFLTALDGGELPQLQAYGVGAVDYVLKPYQPEILRSKVSVFVDLHRANLKVLRQEQALRDAQRREHERQLDEAFKAADAERARIRAEELQRAVQIRDQFLSVASHELKTPITALKLNLQAAQRFAASAKDISGPEMATRIKRLDRSVGQLTSLVDQLLDVSRLSTGKFPVDLEETDLARLVKEVVARFEEDLDRAQCPLTCEIPEQLVGMWDPVRLDQILTNLLSNALKYAGGTPIQVRLSPNGETVELAVRDHGQGIAQEHHERIFERFERLVTDGVSGFGLGLWISRQIVTGMGGTIVVLSQPGAGAEFIVTLPLKSAGRPEAKVQRATG